MKIINTLKQSKLFWFIAIYAISLLAFGIVSSSLHKLVEWLK